MLLGEHTAGIAQKGQSPAKTWGGGLDIAAQVFEKPHGQAGVGVPAYRLVKAGEVKKGLFSIKQANQHTCYNAADKAGHNTRHQRRGSQSHTVNDKLGVEKDGGHHKRRQPVVPNSASGKGCRDGDGAVHTKGRGDTQGGRRHNAQHPQLLVTQRAEGIMHPVFEGHGHQRANDHAQHPVSKNLAELDIKVVPKVNGLAADNVSNRLNRSQPPVRNDFW